MPIDQLRNSFGPEKTDPLREASSSTIRAATPLTIVIAVIMLAIVGVVIAAGVVFGQSGDLVVGIFGFVLLVLGLAWRIRVERGAGTHDPAVL